MPTAEILSQGDEVVTGQIADTNAAWLSERLTDLGFDVVRHTAVGDRLPDLVGLLREIAPRCDLCVSTGGLGPTDDDLTAPAVALAFARPLERDPVALAQIEERFRRFGRTMAPVNRKQADLPQGSERLDNDWGTAPGFAFSGENGPLASGKGAWFACLPGVPREMRAMFDERVLPRLHARFALRPGGLVTVRTIGVGESDLQQRMDDWSAEGVVVGYRTKLPENHVKLRFSPDVPEARVRAHVGAVLERIGQWAYTVEGLPGPPLDGFDCGGGPPAEVVGRALAARGHTLAVAESCTGGRLASLVTDIPGSSRYFERGVVTYSNRSKTEALGVPEGVLKTFGAVSSETAVAMAKGIRRLAKTTYGLAITGIAGPEGGTPEKPVGTVHIAVDSEAGSDCREFHFPTNREWFKMAASFTALDMLRRRLLKEGARGRGKPPPP